MLTNEEVLKINISHLKKVHFIGITAPFSSFCATFLMQKSLKLTASEINQDNEKGRYWIDKGVLYEGGHSEKYITPDLDLVVYPNAPIPGNLECEKAAELKIPAVTVGQLTGLISLNFKTIAIAGTHGKSTTTALTTWLLHKNFTTPNFIIGDAEDSITELNKSWNYNPDSEFLIVEACEYKRQFVQRAPKPYIAVITHIDLDHTDYYKDQSDYNSAFIEFLSSAENIVINKNSANEKLVLRDLVAGGKSAISEAHIYSTDEIKMKFNLSTLPGNHNQENAKRAYLVGKILQIAEPKIIEAIESFKGLAKRFESIGATSKGSLLFKDYAHNPEKVAAVLQGANEKFPDREAVLVFQPHSYERTATFRNELVASLEHASVIIFTNIFSHRREPEEHKSLISEQQFFDLLRNNYPGKKVEYTMGFETLKQTLVDIDNGKQVFIFASAGDLLKNIPNF